MIYITGHRNPDTDTIMGTIVATNLFRKLGYEVTPIKLGELNKETKYIVDRFNLETFETKTRIAEDDQIILVDHNSPMESIENLNDVKVHTIIDHHAVKINTTYPLNYRCEAVGSSNTILYKMYKENNIEITKEIAICMLSAIISDTMLFKSPTTTDEDRKVVEELLKITGLDFEKYGTEMLKAGTDLGDFSEEQIIRIDSKTNDYYGHRLTVAQVNTVDIDEVLKRKEKLEEAMKKEIDKYGLSLFILVITDVLNANSQIIALGKRVDAVEKSYNVKLVNNMAFLPGVVSRKKQIIPVVSENLKDNE